jgi:hypothetical protein
MLYALLVTYAAVVAGIAGLLTRLRPDWSRLWFVIVSAVPGPLLLLVLLAIGFGGTFSYQPAPDDNAGIDARYHALSAYLFFLMTGVPTLLVIGVPISWVMSSTLRRRTASTVQRTQDERP